MKIGFLPLYIKLYDDYTPGSRPRHEAFYEELAGMIEGKGIEVVRSAFCRIAPEFDDAVSMFENEGVDAIVTLHLAYSPSLESIDALTKTKLPIIVLDTTSTLEFTNMQDPGEVTYCHGIHGVMDMCSMLNRNGKEYAIVVGHYLQSDCIDRVCNLVKAAYAANKLKQSRVAIIGGRFDGMGDFAIPSDDMYDVFGVEVLNKNAEEMQAYMDMVTDEEMNAEYQKDKERFDFDDSIIEEEYLESVKSCLAVRKCIENENLSAFTANFRNMGSAAGIAAMPFVEACKAMERGIGYAGEGDPLTASFTGALLSAYPKTSFVEIFCPDWKNNMLFLSHMGEVNYGITNSKPFIKRAKINYVDGAYPYPSYARMMGGKGVFVNISKGGDGFKLVISEAEMVDYKEDNFNNSVRGWMKTKVSTSEFLEQLSKHGATHHSIFVYNATASDMEFFAKLIKVKSVII